MFNKLHDIFYVYLLLLVVAGCTPAEVDKEATTEETVSVLIVGSAEHPDPVLKMVRELEKKGVLKNVIVRESFPVQIEVTGPVSVIRKIQSIPKIKSPSFK